MNHSLPGDLVKASVAATIWEKPGLNVVSTQLGFFVEGDLALIITQKTCSTITADTWSYVVSSAGMGWVHANLLDPVLVGAMIKRLLLIPFLTACTVNFGPPIDAPDSCIEPNTSYSESFVEQPGGTCGPRNPSSISFGPDGNVPLAPGVSCQVAENDGCDSVHQCSLVSASGCVTVFDSHLSFSISSCTSTYTVSGHRQ